MLLGEKGHLLLHHSLHTCFLQAMTHSLGRKRVVGDVGEGLVTTPSDYMSTPPALDSGTCVSPGHL